MAVADVGIALARSCAFCVSSSSASPDAAAQMGSSAGSVVTANSCIQQHTVNIADQHFHIAGNAVHSV